MAAAYCESSSGKLGTATGEGATGVAVGGMAVGVAAAGVRVTPALGVRVGAALDAVDVAVGEGVSSPPPPQEAARVAASMTVARSKARSIGSSLGAAGRAASSSHDISAVKRDVRSGGEKRWAAR
jgi:hypothetical protein